MQIRKLSCWYRQALSFFAFTLVIAVHPIWSQVNSDRGQIRLVANSVQANLADRNSSWSFDGEVKLESGSMILSADRMVAERSEGEIVAVVAEGAPVRFTQNEPNLVTASSSSITYRVNEQTIVLSGEVTLLQDGNEITGERIEYDLSAGELIAGSTDSSDGQQIEFVLDDSD